MKQTPQQKAANKAANTIRRRAYSQRQRAYWAALKKAEESEEVLAAKAAYEKADRATDRMQEGVAQAIAALEQEIAKLQATVDSIRCARDEHTRDERDQAVDVWQEALRSAKDKVKQEFADVAHVFSVTQWKIPADVQAEMDAARSPEVRKPI